MPRLVSLRAGIRAVIRAATLDSTERPASGERGLYPSATGWHDVTSLGRVTQLLNLPPFTPPSGGSLFPTGLVGTNTNNALGLGQLRATPFYLAAPLTITRVGGDIASASTGASTVRLGIYADNGVGRPGVLEVDAGAIDGATAGVQELVLPSSVELAAGWHWIAGVVQGAPTVQPTVRTVNPVLPLGFIITTTPVGSPPTAGTQVSGYSAPITADIGTPLPATFPTGVSSHASTPRIHFRVA